MPGLRWLGRRLLAVEARVQPHCTVHAGIVVLRAILIHVFPPKLRFPLPVIVQPVLRVEGLVQYNPGRVACTLRSDKCELGYKRAVPDVCEKTSTADVRSLCLLCGKPSVWTPIDGV